MNESLTPQELLYMYLDGECTPEQVDVLFGALAKDPALQTEFDEAFAVQKALEEDTSKTGIPFQTTQSIFQRAGVSFIPSSEIASSVTIASTEIVKNSLLQTIVSFINSNYIAISISTLLTLVTGVELQKDKGVSDSNAIKKEKSHSNNKETNNEITKSTFEDSKPITNENSLKVDTDLLLNKEYGISQKFRESKTIQKFTFVQQNDSRISEKVLDIRIDSVTPEITIPSVYISPTLRNEYKENDRAVEESILHTPIKKQSKFLQFFPLEPTMLSIQLRSMTGISNFPNRTNTENPLNNIGTTVLIALNKNHSLGLEISQESFAHFALETQRITNFTTSPLFIPKETILWTGAAYQYTLDPLIDVGSIQPFVRTTIGASAIGGLSKVIVGVQVPIVSGLFSTLGIEGSLFLLNNSSSINTSQKISVSYSLGWSFR